MKKLMIIILIATMFAGCGERLPETPKPTTKVYENDFVKAVVPYDAYTERHHLSLGGAWIKITMNEIGRPLWQKTLELYTDTFNGYPCIIEIIEKQPDEGLERSIDMPVDGANISITIVADERNDLVEMFENSFELKKQSECFKRIE